MNMCGKAFDGTSFRVSCSEDHSGLLQIIGGGHGVSGKNHEHSHEENGHYEGKGREYHEGPEYEGMNPEDILTSPVMRYFSAADNKNYSPMENYSQKENSSYQEAA